ncbi:MAG: hypothetical protein WB709_05945 [Solirubrobacteraceae bacterium]
MSDRWEIHDAPYGGIWFVLHTNSEMEVIAPPGIRITLGEGRDPMVPGLLPGWRRVKLPDDDDLDPQAIDDADAICVSTRDVLDRLGPESASEIKQIMIAQLSMALALAQAEDDSVGDGRARAGSRGVTWALSELRDAFPNERWELSKGLGCAEYDPHVSVSADLLPRTGTTDVKTKPMRSASAAMPAQAQSTRARARA